MLVCFLLLGFNSGDLFKHRNVLGVFFYEPEGVLFIIILGSERHKSIKRFELGPGLSLRCLLGQKLPSSLSKRTKSAHFCHWHLYIFIPKNVIKLQRGCRQKGSFFSLGSFIIRTRYIYTYTSIFWSVTAAENWLTLTSEYDPWITPVDCTD